MKMVNFHSSLFPPRAWGLVIKRNDKMNILSLLKYDKIIPVHVSGDEWRSPCPECGGVDRFSSWPSKLNRNGRYGGGRYDCR